MLYGCGKARPAKATIDLHDSDSEPFWIDLRLHEEVGQRKSTCFLRVKFGKYSVGIPFLRNHMDFVLVPGGHLDSRPSWHVQPKA